MPLMSSSVSPMDDIPDDIWDNIFMNLSHDELWELRALNHAAYALAAQSVYGTLSIRPYGTKLLRGKLARIRERRLRISGLLHTLHVHSDISEAEPELFKGTVKLIEKTLSKPTLDIRHLTIHLTLSIQPYATWITSRFAHSLVNLELQFVNSSVADFLDALPADICFNKLESFSFIYGTGNYHSPPLFHSTTVLPMWSGSRNQALTTPILERVFNRLGTLLPATLTSLTIHRLADRGSMLYHIDPSFLLPGAYPFLKNLHLSGISFEWEPSLRRFLIERIGTLETLTIEGTDRKYTATISNVFLQFSPAENLTELYLTWEAYQSLTDKAGAKAFIQFLPRLRRLDIDVHLSDRILDPDREFVLLVNIGRSGSKLEELNIHVDCLDLRLLGAALLLLRRTRLTLFVPTCSPRVVELSGNPAMWKTSLYNPHVYRIHNLGRARMRVGPLVRHAMEVELQKNVRDVAHAFSATTLEEKSELKLSVAKALEDVDGLFSDSLSRLEGPAENSQDIIVKLVEDCLEILDSESARVWLERHQMRNSWDLNEEIERGDAN
ncbi:hypothetical protein DL96DRAFT_1634615 [Flagelloscypha sp. PMI_526]|nr:hypothetical protein DL96DRAFT_1634615 [Flagelloscypha sp. PMI_526]